MKLSEIVFLAAVLVTCIADVLTDAHFDPAWLTWWRNQPVPFFKDWWHVAKVFRLYPMILLAGFYAYGFRPTKRTAILWAVTILAATVAWNLFSPWHSRWFVWM